MGSQEILFDNIERYLDGSMAGAELKAFNAKLKTDKDLQKEVKLHKDLASLLADSTETDFRESLEKLGNRMKDTNARNNSWQKYLLLLPLFLIAGWWFTQADNTPEPSPIETIEEDRQPTISTKDLKETGPDLDGLPPEELKEIEQEATQPIKTNVPNKKTTAPNKFADKPTSPKEQAPTLLAGNFEPNPSLDFLIENNRRGDEIEFKIERQSGNFILKSKDQAVDFQLSGTFDSELELLKKTFNLNIFSNKKEDYQRFLPLSSDELKLVNVAEHSFKFDFRKAIVLKPGLYYYLLEDRETEEIFFVEKFEVR